MTAPLPSSQKDSAKPIILVSYPKIVILYPTYLMAILAGVLTLIFGEEKYSHGVGVAFLAIMGVNLVVLAFDFPRTTSLNLFFVFLVIIMGTVLTSVYVPTLLPALTK
ncbi:MAG TPA: hypothetical protein VGM98_13170, partial [Schlesneria sp.]